MSGSVVRGGYPTEVSLVDNYTGFIKYSNGKKSGCTYGNKVHHVDGILKVKAANYLIVNSCAKAYAEIMIFDKYGYVKKHYYYTKNGVVSVTNFGDWLRG